MPLVFAVVCEAEADFRTATRLAERVLCGSPHSWLEMGHLDNCSLWHGLDHQKKYPLWKDVRKQADQAGIPPIRGEFNGRAGEPDAKTALRALRLLKHKLGNQPLQGVMLIRDSDGDESRRAGLREARENVEDLRDRVVIGLACSMRECWVLAGFDPENSEEERRLVQVRAELGFDPRAGSHQLTARDENAKRSSKRVLHKLIQGGHEREAKCWEKSALAVLHQRGQESGLAEFLGEVSSRLLPLVLTRPRA